jgi:ring-1,2-phenylacetyl-CoA epoxidase subunit PaaD
MNTTLSIDQIWDILNTIPDPEVPAISIVELGVVRNVEVTGNGLMITMTPTYNGCPALKAMEDEIIIALQKEGITEVHFKMIYKPAWTTDWLSDATKKKMEDYGIAPPEGPAAAHFLPFSEKTDVKCPFCKSADTKITSQFGSTACKALYFCSHCHQPFEHFKCH